MCKFQTLCMIWIQIKMLWILQAQKSFLFYCTLVFWKTIWKPWKQSKTSFFRGIIRWFLSFSRIRNVINVIEIELSNIFIFADMYLPAPVLLLLASNIDTSWRIHFDDTSLLVKVHTLYHQKWWYHLLKHNCEKLQMLFPKKSWH